MDNYIISVVDNDRFSYYEKYHAYPRNKENDSDIGFLGLFGHYVLSLVKPKIIKYICQMQDNGNYGTEKTT